MEDQPPDTLVSSLNVSYDQAADELTVTSDPGGESVFMRAVGPQSSDSNSFAITQVLAAPTGVFLSDQQPLSIQVNWTANTEPSLKDYLVYKSLIGPVAGFSLLAVVVAPTILYVDITFVTGVPQWYKLTARDTSDNESQFSLVVSGGGPIDFVWAKPTQHQNGDPILPGTH